MARRERSFFFDNKTGKLKSNGKTIIDATDSANLVQTEGSAAGNPVNISAIGDDTNIDIRITPKGSGNVEILGPLEVLTGNRIIDSAGTNVEFGDDIHMNSNKITNLGTPTANTDASTKAYVDTKVGSYLPLTGGTISSNLTVSGNFTVNGTTTTINTSTLSVADNLIDLNSDVTSGTPSQDAGIRILRGDSNAVQLRWNETNDKWELTTDGASYANIAVIGDIPTAVSELTNDSGYITGYTVTQGDVTAHQAALSITESQISDLSHTTSLAFAAITSTPTTLSGYGITDAVASSAISTFGGTLVDDADASAARTTLGLGTAATTASTDYATAAQGAKADTAHGWGNHASAGYLTSYTETNDLSAAVTWANVPNANITQSSVTQHQAALSITESQISDLGTYLTSVALNDVSDVTITTPSSGQVLKYNGSAWVNDTDSGGIALTDLSVTQNAVGTAALSYNNTTGVFSYTPPDLSSYLTSYTVTQSDVTTHQAALSITESQISDLGTYLTASDITGKLNLSGGTMSGAIAMGTNKITGMGDPTAAQDAATKAYVDSQVSSAPTGDITSVTASTGLTGGGTTGDVTLSIDSTVATLTGTQTLTNKTLTNPTINAFSGTGDGTVTGNLTVTSNVNADNFTTEGLKIVDNNIQSTRSNDHINLVPNGTGSVQINGSVWPTDLGTDGYVLTTDGAGTLTWAESGSGGITAGHTIQNAGSNLTARAGLNFDGTYIIATDDSGNSQTDITLSSQLQALHNTTMPTGAVVGTSDTQTLSNKTIDSATNTLTLDLSEGTLTGTTAEFNTALSDDSFATLTNTVTLTNKTLTSPTITSPSMSSATVTTSLGLNAQASLQFKDSDSSNYVAFKAPATVTSDITWTLPAADGANTQVLTTNGSGVLSWSDGGGGGGGASTMSGLGDTTISDTIKNDLLVYDGSAWVNKNPHEVVPNIPFTKADSTLQYLSLVNKRDMTSIMGFLNDRVVQSYYVPFTKADETAVTTLVLG